MGILRIYAVDGRDGTGLQPLTSCVGFGSGCFNDTPAWSPDGTKIVFIHGDDYDVVEDHPVNQQVWVMDRTGPTRTRSRRVRTPRTRSPTGVPTARRSPSTPSRRGGQIWVMDANGANRSS